MNLIQPVSNKGTSLYSSDGVVNSATPVIYHRSSERLRLQLRRGLSNGGRRTQDTEGRALAF